MRTKYFVVVLLAAVVAFGACGKKKSDQCELLTVRIDGETYTLSGSTFAKLYPKDCPSGSHPSLPSWPQRAEVTFSKGATITPDINVQRNYETGVEFTVTAEDGKTTKKFTIKADKDMSTCP